MTQKKPRTFKKIPPKSARKPRKSRGFLRFLWISGISLFLICTLAGFIGAGYIYFKYSKDLPDVRVLKNYHPNIITQLYSEKDELIAEFYVEKRILVPAEKIPRQLKQATLAVEDSNFYSHFGIDPKAIFRAMITNFQAGHVVEGGSTITQQLAKTLFLTPQRNLERKIREAILAVRLEMIFTKEEILEMYLNQIYYGHGAYGVEGAAQTYFGKHVEELAVEECALIAALPKAPNNYSPYRNLKKATARRNHALRRMATLNFISQAEMELLTKTNIRLGGISDKLNKAPYFVEYIRQFIQDEYGSSKVYRDGLKVFTTLNLKNQLVAQGAIRTNLRVADKRYGYRGPIDRISVGEDLYELQQYVSRINEEGSNDYNETHNISRGVVLDVDDQDVLVLMSSGEGIINISDMEWARKPNIKLDGRWAKIKHPSNALTRGDVIWVKKLDVREDGRWRAALEQEPEVEGALMSLDRKGHIKSMVGGYDFGRSQFNRAVQAIRQPGSAFKPIIFAGAISEGFTPASIIIDSPVIFKENEHDFDKWKPANFEKKFYGPTSLRTALTHSRNVVTIKLLQSIGIQNAISLARQFGITSHMEDNLSIALGSSGLTLFELTSAYSVFANLGKRIKPVSIRYIEDRKGQVIYQPLPEVEQVLKSGVGYLVTSLMQSVVNEGTGSKVKALNRPVAGKTGTTNDFVDAWFLGFTPELITGVWVGKDVDEPLGVNETGSRTAIPIWLEYMQAALGGLPIQDFPISKEVSFYKINPETGKAVTSNNGNSKFEVFLTDHPPEKDINSSQSIMANNF